MSIDNQSFCVIWPNPRLQNCIISRYRNLFSFLHCKPLENLIDFPCKMHSSHNKFQRMLRCCHAVSRPVRWAFSSHPLTTSFEKAVRMQPMREGGTILKKVPHGAPGFSAFRWTNAIGALIEIIPHNFKIVKSDTHYLVDIPKKNSFGSSLCTRKKDVSQKIFCTAASKTHISQKNRASAGAKPCFGSEPAMHLYMHSAVFCHIRSQRFLPVRRLHMGKQWGRFADKVSLLLIPA